MMSAEDDERGKESLSCVIVFLLVVSYLVNKNIIGSNFVDLLGV